MNFAITLNHNVQTNIAHSTNLELRSQAIRSALKFVTRTHPDYAGVGFDMDFMTTKAATILEPFLNDGQLPTSNALIAAWAEKFDRFSENVKQTAAANIAPMVNDFVYVLATEAANIATVEDPAISQTGGYANEPTFGAA